MLLSVKTSFPFNNFVSNLIHGLFEIEHDNLILMFIHSCIWYKFRLVNVYGINFQNVYKFSSSIMKKIYLIIT